MAEARGNCSVHRYAVIRPSLDLHGTIEVPEIAHMTERHHFKLPPIAFRSGDVAALADGAERPKGAIFVLEQGLPTRRQLHLLSRFQSRGMGTFLAWPHENVIEVVDRERLASLRRHWLAAVLGYRLNAWRAKRRAASAGTALQTSTDLVKGEVESVQGQLAGGVTALKASKAPEVAALADRFADALTSLDHVRDRIAELAAQIAVPGAAQPTISTSAGPYTDADLPRVQAFLDSLLEAPQPVAFAPGTFPEPGRPLPGTGVYLRLDFWAPLTSGGSYGHTCYQAKALARTCQDFVCITANPFPLLDKLLVRQVTIPGRDNIQTEVNLLGMNQHYAERLGPLFDAMRPSFIFERIVLGSAVGAWASRQFGIPYIAEYNGSEISMKLSFEGQGYRHEDLLRAAEDAAFRQATLISVVSDHVAEYVARRGIPRERILVNPNAVDLNDYSPASPDEARRLRTVLGFSPHHRVVGFIGTFGGWHGIEVLAEALPGIVEADERIRVLLIGDGNLKQLVRRAVTSRGIQDRVVDVGRVPQEEGAELLKACDILVSPHSRNMVDSPFFGSPTKLFEYMATGAGIVASDLEQIGHVLSPALRTTDIAAARAAGRPVEVTEQRAILCRPGDVADFVEAVRALAADPALSAMLGRNARAAAERYYSWDQHVRDLWLTIAGRPTEGYSADRQKG